MAKKQKSKNKKVPKRKRVVKEIGRNSKKKDNVFKKEDRKVFAKAKYIPGSPRKARLVIDLVRGRMVVEVLAELNYVNKRAARPIKKTIESAVANAVNNFEMDRKNLEIVEAYIDKAPTFKRGRAGSRGRYKKILKRNYHIVIGLKEKK